MNINEQNLNIEKAVIKTIAFFDLFGRPLSAEELWRYCGEECGLDELKCAAQHLEDGILAPQLPALRCGKTMEPAKGLEDVKRIAVENSGLRGETGTLYCLRGRGEIIEQKKQADALVKKKHKIALRAAKILRFINGAKMIAVCNNISYSEESDVDLFIIIERGRLWLSRFLITLAMHIFGLRRHGENYIADRVCLSFYISDEKMNINDIALQPADPYLCCWLALLKPIYGYDCYVDFFNANGWLKTIMPNVSAWKREECELIDDASSSRMIKKISSFWFAGRRGDFLEKIVKKMQLKKMARNLNSVAKENDTRVIISDTMLKFHEKDRRAEYGDMWRERIKEL